MASFFQINPSRSMHFRKFNFYFQISLCCLKRFYEGLETPQRSVKIKDFFSKRDQIRRKLTEYWKNTTHLLKKYLMQNLIFCSVKWLTDIYETLVGFSEQTILSQEISQDSEKNPSRLFLHPKSAFWS